MAHTGGSSHLQTVPAKRETSEAQRGARLGSSRMCAGEATQSQAGWDHTSPSQCWAEGSLRLTQGCWSSNSSCATQGHPTPKTGPSQAGQRRHTRNAEWHTLSPGSGGLLRSGHCTEHTLPYCCCLSSLPPATEKSLLRKGLVLRLPTFFPFGVAFWRKGLKLSQRAGWNRNGQCWHWPVFGKPYCHGINKLSGQSRRYKGSACHAPGARWGQLLSREKCTALAWYL